MTTEFAPYYFDSELVSANVRTATGLASDDEFVFEVNVDDDERRAEPSRRLEADDAGE